MIAADKKDKKRKTDRALVLRPIDEKLVMSGRGTLDPSLFRGENKLHIVKHPENNLWYFRYERGVLQESLKGMYTTYDAAYRHAERYFLRRGVKIEQVID